MAVFTPIDLNDAHAFLRHYDVAETAEALDPISAGTDNTNYVLTADNNKYILTIFEDRIDKSHLPGILEFTAACYGNPTRTPKAYTRSDGGILCKIKDKPAALIEYIEGRSILTPKPEHAGQMGSTLANMHLTGLDKGVKLHKNTLGFDRFHAIYEGAKSYLNSQDQQEIQSLIDRLGSPWQKLSNCPKGAIHADAFPDNVFFIGDEISGIIDFYFACEDAFIYDMMLTETAWCFDEKGGILKDNQTAFRQGYETVRVLSEIERTALNTAGLGAAFRIYATRLRDISQAQSNNGKVFIPKDPSQYLNIMRHYGALL